MTKQEAIRALDEIKDRVDAIGSDLRFRHEIREDEEVGEELMGLMMRMEAAIAALHDAETH